MYEEGETVRLRNSNSHFKIIDCITDGGQSLVYIARREKEKDVFALKTPKHKSATGFYFADIGSFKWESNVWISLGKHKNIVQAFWYDYSDQNEPFLVMDYIQPSTRGLTLRSWMKHYKNQSSQNERISFSLFVIYNILSGLIYARNRVRDKIDSKLNFIHRDLKPENIFINNSNTIKITDFGLVKAFSQLDRLGGTFSYMPPEQWKGEEVSEKTDIYALGCIIYEIFVGRKAFPTPIRHGVYSNEDLVDIMQNLHSCANYHNQLRIKGDLHEIFKNCTRIEASERFSFDELFNTVQKKLNSLSNIFSTSQEPIEYSADEYNWMGIGVSQLGYPDRAASYLEKAISIDPSNGKYFLNRANLYTKNKDYKNALAYYEQAIKHQPSLTSAFLGKCAVLELLGRLNEAQATYNLLRQKKKIDDQFYFNFARFHIKYLRKSCTGYFYFKKALHLNPNFIECIFSIGKLYLIWHLNSLALRCFLKVLPYKYVLHPINLQLMKNSIENNSKFKKKVSAAKLEQYLQDI